MLAQKQLNKNDVVVFRVSSGEEILGRFVAEDDKTITMAKIVGIGLRMQPNNQAAITFIPFLGSTDDSGETVFFKSSLVTVPQKPRNDVEKGYIEATSPLVMPKNSGASSILKA